MGKKCFAPTELRDTHPLKLYTSHRYAAQATIATFSFHRLHFRTGDELAGFAAGGGGFAVCVSVFCVDKDLT